MSLFFLAVIIEIAYIHVTINRELWSWII